MTELVLRLGGNAGYVADHNGMRSFPVDYAVGDGNSAAVLSERAL